MFHPFPTFLPSQFLEQTHRLAQAPCLLTIYLAMHTDFFFQNPVACAFLSSCVLCPHLLKFFGVILMVLSCYNWKTLTTIWSSSSPLELNKSNATEVKLNHTRPTSKPEFGDLEYKLMIFPPPKMYFLIIFYLMPYTVTGGCSYVDLLCID